MTTPPVAKVLFLRDLVWNRLRRRKVPLFLYWFVTGRCNYRCAYCYGALQWENRSDLPTDVMLRMVDEMADAGVRRVNLIGGEPFLREDLGLLVQRLFKRRVSICILCNGSLLADRVEEIRGVHEVGMSIDGGEQTHDAIRGRGAFRELVNAIEACRRRGITVVLTYTMVAQNVSDLEQVMDFVRQHGVNLTVNVAHGRVFGAGDLPISKADNEVCRRALEQIAEYQRRGYPVFRTRRTLELMRSWEDFRIDTSDATSRKGFPVCRFGSYGASLCADGTLIPCFLNSHREPGLSVPERGFAEAWEHCKKMGHCAYCHVPCFLEYNAIFGLSLPVLFNAAMKLHVYPLVNRLRS